MFGVEYGHGQWGAVGLSTSLPGLPQQLLVLTKSLPQQMQLWLYQGLLVTLQTLHVEKALPAAHFLLLLGHFAQGWCLWQAER